MTPRDKKIVVIGASPKPFRYSYSAVSELKNKGYPVVAIGLRNDFIGDVEIKTGQPPIADADTVTMYVGPKNQGTFYEYIIQEIKPRRIIFNPGTENDELVTLANKNGIEVVEDCTLRMLAFDTF